MRECYWWCPGMSWALGQEVYIAAIMSYRRIRRKMNYIRDYVGSWKEACVTEYLIIFNWRDRRKPWSSLVILDFRLPRQQLQKVLRPGTWCDFIRNFWSDWRRQTNQMYIFIVTHIIGTNLQCYSHNNFTIMNKIDKRMIVSPVWTNRNINYWAECFQI
jgi:hypothetical protein